MLPELLDMLESLDLLLAFWLRLLFEDAEEAAVPANSRNFELGKDLIVPYLSTDSCMERRETVPFPVMMVPFVAGRGAGVDLE